MAFRLSMNRQSLAALKAATVPPKPQASSDRLSARKTARAAVVWTRVVQKLPDEGQGATSLGTKLADRRRQTSVISRLTFVLVRHVHRALNRRPHFAKFGPQRLPGDAECLCSLLPVAFRMLQHHRN